jgi:hypothetical protein
VQAGRGIAQFCACRPALKLIGGDHLLMCY